MNVAIVGAGLAGLSAARALLGRGVERITVFERREGPGLETSFANGALLHPSMPEPWNSPGIARDLVRSLGREDAPALLRLRALPSLVGWGLAFLRESSPLRYRHNALANLELARYSARQMAGVLSEGIDYHHRETGSLMLFRDMRAMQSAVTWAQVMSDAGRAYETWTVEEAVEAEPTLRPIAGDVVGAIFNPDDVRGDAWRYCEHLSRRLADRGVAFRYNEIVRSLVMRHGEVRGLIDNQGEAHEFDAVVVAAACLSPLLARSAGLEVPVRPAKGYSLTLRPPGEVRLPRVPVVDATLHVAVVPVGDDRLRIAGTAEFTGLDLSLNPHRVANLWRLLGRVYPEVTAETPDDRVMAWTGLRPMVPDGVPLIGPTRVPGLFLNTGHGHLGWTLAAGSAQLLADLMTGHPPEVESPRRYAPARFGL